MPSRSRSSLFGSRGSARNTAWARHRGNAGIRDPAVACSRRLSSGTKRVEIHEARPGAERPPAAGELVPDERHGDRRLVAQQHAPSCPDGRGGRAVPRVPCARPRSGLLGSRGPLVGHRAVDCAIDRAAHLAKLAAGGEGAPAPRAGHPARDVGVGLPPTSTARERSGIPGLFATVDGGSPRRAAGPDRDRGRPNGPAKATPIQR
jgi:hypothetical protein